MDTFLQELRVAVRLLARQKTFAVAAIGTLGICIAASATTFCLLNAVVLRPLPFAGADRIAFVYNSYPRAGVQVGGAAIPDYFDRRVLTATFDAVAVFRATTQTIGVPGSPERVQTMIATPSLFRLLGVTPAIGRPFTEQEGEPGNERKVILSYELWQRLFAGRNDAIGSDLRINEVPHTIVGVMPAGFRFWSNEVAVWIPAAFTPADRSDDARFNGNFNMVARLRPGVSVASAAREIAAVNQRLLDRLPALKPLLIDIGYRSDVVPLQDFLVRDVKRTLYLLWGGSLLVLLIGCVNIANLTLVRATGRMKEMATRHALGAGVGRLARQLVTETMLLALAGGVVGVLAGTWVLSLMRTRFETLSGAFALRMDPMAIGYTLAITVAVGIVIGLAPIAGLRQRNFTRAVREEGRSGTAARGTRMVRRVLVTAQVALALVLVAGSGLLFSSFRQVLALDPGFRPENVWTGIVNLPAARYSSDDSLRAFAARLLDRVRTTPGVASVALTDVIPFGPNTSDSVVFAEGHPPKPGEPTISSYRNTVSTGYFETMGIRLLRGRFFDDHDTAASLPVMIVDDRIAKRFWPGEDPIGKRMWYPEDAQHMMPDARTTYLTVVGVVNTVRQKDVTGAGDRLGAVYFPMTQSPRRTVILALKSTVEPTALTSAMRLAVRQLDAELPLYSVRTMIERRDATVQNRRTPLLLSVTFGAIALFLAVIGIYAVLAYQVTQRRREIGIRMALGGTSVRIFSLVLGEGLVMVVAGSLLGLAGSFAIGRLLESQLYGVRPGDPLVMAATFCAVGIVAVLACLFPARRAAQTDPVRALNDL